MVLERVGVAVAGVGRTVAWLTMALVLVTFAVVVLRYGFNLGWIWLQESITYLHGAVFMLAAAWALQDDAHVRVDVFYRKRTARQQALVDLAGTVLFLVPLCLFLLATGWEYVWRSWQVMEGSREAGGLPLVYLFKSLILLLPALLLAQASCAFHSSLRVLRARHSGEETP